MRKIFLVLLLILSVSADEIVTCFTTYPEAQEHSGYYEECYTDPSYRNTQDSAQLLTDTYFIGFLSGMVNYGLMSSC